MVREKKDSRAFSIRMDSGTFERLEKYCEEAGQTKTVAIERAINQYIDDYEDKMRKLKKIK